MTAPRTRSTIALLLILSVTACQSSGTAQPTPSPSGIEPTATPEVTTNPADIPAGLILFSRPGSDDAERFFTIKTDGTDEQAVCEQGCGGARWSADWSQVRSIGATGTGPGR